MNFSKHVNDVGDVHVVTLEGELDLDTATGLSDWLVDISGSTVVIDLSGLTFMDSSGISAVLVARQRILANGADLKLTRPTAIVGRVLEIVGLGELVEAWDPAWGR